MILVKHKSISPYLHEIIELSIYVEDFEEFSFILKSAIIRSTFLSKSVTSSLSAKYFDFL